ncbi:multicopper oxidase domain-containing protein [Methyloglobulus sp.]|uniref:multicopper oxidase family protein n=1 Tax=Methyloglobulus sp. TaxID=2518622 RepID=UPI0032B7D98A
MSISKFQSRRNFIKQTSIGLLAFASMPSWINAAEGMHGMPILPPRKASANFKPDVELELFCQNTEAPVLAGKTTRVQKYSAKLLHGPEQSVTEIPSSYLGPVIRLQKGQKVRIHLHNQLDEDTITHWHGLHVPAEVDGHPMYVIGQGQTFVYEFEVVNRACMAIYHPHPHEATAKQVYHGLAGAIIVNDEIEAALGLPSGEFEIPIVIQDRLFDLQNQLIYSPGMHGNMFGFYGNRILVNGHPELQLEVASRAYRLRFLNGSTARIYKLAWDDGTPITVLGVDGGLLEQPEQKPYVMLAPGERLDVWMDFSGRAVGSELVMRSLPFSGALPHMGMGMMGNNGYGLPMQSDYAIFSVKINKKVSDSPKLPTALSKISRYEISDTHNPNKPVPITISEGHMSMLLNGRPYAYKDIQANERIPVHTIQLMEISHEHGMGGMGNGGGMGMGRMGMGGMGMGGMMAMAHPIHLHGQQFQIVSRSIDSSREGDYATVNQGFINSGLKDTVLVMPGETVRIIKPFQDYKGLFMFHCHNLEHEDMGMMRDFLVE